MAGMGEVGNEIYEAVFGAGRDLPLEQLLGQAMLATETMQQRVQVSTRGSQNAGIRELTVDIVNVAFHLQEAAGALASARARVTTYFGQTGLSAPE